MEPGESRDNVTLVLVVDDDESMRLLARQSLELAGLSVEEAEDGPTALAATERIRPDIVLLDVSMPAMDGFTVCERLRELPATRNTPILMMTARDDLDSIHRAYDVGATDFVTKPPNWVILGHRVRYMVRASRRADELRRSKAILARAQRIAHLGWWMWDPAKATLAASDECRKMIGSDEADTDTSFESLLRRVHEEDLGVVESAVEKALRSGQPFSVDHRTVGADGTIRIIHHQAQLSHDEPDLGPKMIGTVQDVTERKQDEEQIRRLAYFDKLTGLPNRWLFEDRLKLAIKAAARHQRLAAILFLDLDHFKRINDTLGHSAGDSLLKQVGERLLACVRGTDCVARIDAEPSDTVVARLGGDEFIILVSEMSHVQDAARVARRVVDALAQPFRLNSREIFSTSSVGISVFPFDGEDMDSLLKNADTAMYHAKERGRNNYQFYNESMNATALERLIFENNLRRALDRQEFTLHYQPQIDIRSGRIVGAEALLRWQHPEMGLVPPSEFIPLAEETGLIVPIGEWVLRTACLQAVQWKKEGVWQLRVAVNVSARQFHRDDFMDTVSRILSETNVHPGDLDLELTETVIMGDASSSVESLERLKAMGVSLSIDDFGTGYSSLSYLKRFPLDALKIDRSFLAGIPKDEDHIAITQAIIAMGHSLKLKVIAEGVELREQFDFLRAAGCDEFQGYLISPPVPLGRFSELLQHQRDLTSRSPAVNA